MARIRFMAVLASIGGMAVETKAYRRKGGNCTVEGAVTLLRES